MLLDIAEAKQSDSWRPMLGPFASRFVFVFRMAILCRLSMGVIKRRWKKDGHGSATSVQLRVPQRHKLKTRAPALMSTSPNQLYVPRLGDVIDIGPLQLACHVSCYATSTFSQFCHEYLLDTARMIWWESHHPDGAQPSPSLEAILPRFFDRLNCAAMARTYEVFPMPVINPNRAGTT